VKRAVSILIILLSLASAMRITIDRHFCGGRVADVKLALSGLRASCGMEEDNMKSPDYDAFKPHCCYNESSAYTVDNYIISCAMSVEKPFSFIKVLFEEPVYNITGFGTTPVATPGSGPPGPNPLRPCGQSILCVFRI
jgi:hypothetical protein